MMSELTGSQIVEKLSKGEMQEGEAVRLLSNLKDFVFPENLKDLHIKVLEFQKDLLNGSKMVIM